MHDIVKQKETYYFFVSVVAAALVYTYMRNKCGNNTFDKFISFVGAIVAFSATEALLEKM